MKTHARLGRLIVPVLLFGLACGGGGGPTDPGGSDAGGQLGGGSDSGNDGSTQNSGTVVGTATSAGGTLVGASGKVQLDIPAGALSDSVQITVDSAFGLPSSADLVSGTSYTFGPDGLTFAHPVALTITYDPANLPSGRSQASLGLYKALSSSWEEVESVEVDTVAHTVTGWIGGFSSYGLQGGRVENVGGTWKVVETVLTDECEDDVGATYGHTVDIVQDGADITVTVDGEDYTGKVDGSVVVWSGSFDEDGGTVSDKLRALIDAGGNHFEGTSVWTYTSDDVTCGGSSTFAGDRS